MTTHTFTRQPTRASVVGGRIAGVVAASVTSAGFGLITAIACGYLIAKTHRRDRRTAVAIGYAVGSALLAIVVLGIATITLLLIALSNYHGEVF